MLEASGRFGEEKVLFQLLTLWVENLAVIFILSLLPEGYDMTDRLIDNIRMKMEKIKLPLLITTKLQ